MNIHLKVKICALAAESKIIRTQQCNLLKKAGRPPSFVYNTKENIIPLDDADVENIKRLRLERKRHKAKLAIIKMGQKPLQLWPSLQEHRRNHVRQAARHALIAYGFLRNRPYFALEHKFHTEPDWKEVEKNILRFTTEIDKRIVLQRYEQWRQRGREDQDQYARERQTSQAA